MSRFKIAIIVYLVTSMKKKTVAPSWDFSTRSLSPTVGQRDLVTKSHWTKRPGDKVPLSLRVGLRDLVEKSHSREGEHFAGVGKGSLGGVAREHTGDLAHAVLALDA